MGSSDSKRAENSNESDRSPNAKQNKIEYLEDEPPNRAKHVGNAKNYLNNPRYVELPFYDENRWGLIYNNLSYLYSNIKTSPNFEFSSIEKIIMSYNEEFRNSWNFSILFEFWDQMNKNILRGFLLNLINLTLDLPSLMAGQPIPVLARGKSKHVSLSQMQCASILANAFFCTFPVSENRNLNSINFNRYKF